MTETLKEQIKELNEAWNIGIKGENPKCDIILNEILSTMLNMNTDEMSNVFDELSNDNITQICPIIEELLNSNSSLIDKLMSIAKNNQALKEELTIIGIAS